MFVSFLRVWGVLKIAISVTSYAESNETPQDNHMMLCNMNCYVFCSFFKSSAYGKQAKTRLYM